MSTPRVFRPPRADCPMLAEEQAGFDRPGNAFAEGAYGWCKLMGEFQLEQIAQPRALHGCGGPHLQRLRRARERDPRGDRAHRKGRPASVTRSPCGEPGAGPQLHPRADTVTGLLLLGALQDSIPFRLREHRIQQSLHDHRVPGPAVRAPGVAAADDPARHWRAVGVASRASDNTLIRSIFDWEPSMGLEEGLEKTLSWYLTRRDRPSTAENLEPLLLAR